MSDCKIEISGTLDPDQTMVAFYALLILTHYKPKDFETFRCQVETMIELTENVGCQRGQEVA